MFKPDYNNILMAAKNIEAPRVPLYEHIVGNNAMEKLENKEIGKYYESDKSTFFKRYCEFFLHSGYDTVSFEGCITRVLPNGGALAHPMPGYIDSREKFDSYPFDKVKDLYIKEFDADFKALSQNMPEGMKAIGGIGNGVFEIAQDLVGYQNLCLLSYDDPEMYTELFEKIGNMMSGIWEWLLDSYGDAFCVCRFGDDLGYKLNTMLPHDDIRKNIIPQYRKITDLVHKAAKPFLLHSCGCIFPVMDDIIESAKIDAKHSNEDQIAPFKKWVDDYGKRIGNFGGMDTDHLVRKSDEEIEKITIDLLDYCAKGKGGFALGSGNSIPDYVIPEKYAVMINTVRRYRGDF